MEEKKFTADAWKCCNKSPYCDCEERYEEALRNFKDKRGKE